MTDLTWVLSSSVLILAVSAIRAAFGRRMRPGLRCALWGLVPLRLLVPVQLFPAPWGVSAKLPERVEEQEVYLLPVERTGHPTSAVVSSGPEGVALSEDLLDERAQWTERNDETWTFTRFAERRSVADILLIVWLVGIGVTAAVFLVSNLRFYVRLRRHRKPLAVDCPLRVYAVEALSSSCLSGNAIYVAAETALDERRLRHVLAHELSHHRHGDRIWTLLRCAALALHWYHPLVWWAAVLSRQDSELWADTGALRQLGEDEREPYGETLIELSAGHTAKASLICTATTMTNGKRSLKERVTMIAHRPRMTAAVLAAVTLIAAVSAGCAFAGAGTEAKTEADTEIQNGAESAQTSDDGIPPTGQYDSDLEASAAVLPRYQYHGEDPYLPAVCAWIVGEWERGGYWQTKVTIPCPLIAEVDDADPQDIRIWGNFWSFSYTPRATTLFCVSAGERPGLLHLRATELGYEVFDAEIVRDGTYYGKDMLRIFGANRMLKLNGIDADAVRGQFIADYVRWNDLLLTQYQDYGWNPVPIPGAPETPESAQFVRFQDPAGWSIDYDLRAFSLNEYGEGKLGLSGVGDLQGISILLEQHPDSAAGVVSELAEQMEQPEQKAAVIGAEQTPAALLRDGATRQEVIKDTYVVPLPDGGCLTVTVRNTYYNMPGDQVVPGAGAVLENTLASFRLTVPAAAESQSGNGAALTEEALEGWREALSTFQMEDTGLVTCTPVSCFFTSAYADPRDLDLAKFLAYCLPLAEPVEEEAEFESVVSGSLWEEFVSSEDGSARRRTLSEMPVPVHRYRVSRINDVLTQYAGITLDDLHTDWRHDGRTIYVPEYDAFYNFISDFGPGVFEPRSGERSGDIVTLRGDHTVLRLRVTDGGYRILSHLPIGAEGTEDG